MNTRTTYESEYVDWKHVREATKRADLFYDSMVGILEGRPPTTPCPLCPELGYRPGELTEYAGINGHGKSLVTGQIIQSLALQGIRQCVVSPEMRPERTLLRMFRQAFGRMPDPARDKIAIASWLAWIKDYVLLYDVEGDISSESVLGAYLVNARDFGIKHFWIDNLMHVVKGEDTYNEQKEFVIALKQLAKDTNTHCHLVCHARKGKTEDEVIGKFDIRGAAAITDCADNVVLIQRNTLKDKKRAVNQLSPAEDREIADATFTVSKQRNGDYDNKTKLLWLDFKSRAFCDSPERSRPELVPDGLFTENYNDRFRYV